MIHLVLIFFASMFSRKQSLEPSSNMKMNCVREATSPIMGTVNWLPKPNSDVFLPMPFRRNQQKVRV